VLPPARRCRRDVRDGLRPFAKQCCSTSRCAETWFLVRCSLWTTHMHSAISGGASLPSFERAARSRAAALSRDGLFVEGSSAFQHPKEAVMVTMFLVRASAVRLVCAALMIGVPGLDRNAWSAEATAEAKLPMVVPREDVARITDMALPELLDATAGGVSDQAVDKHAGNFASYWTTCQGGREGKAFEAVICDTHNHRAAASGWGERLVPTAAVGYPHDTADLLLVGAGGRVLRRAQAKSGVAALSAKSAPPQSAALSTKTQWLTVGDPPVTSNPPP